MKQNPSPLVGLAVGDALGMPFETAHMLDSRLLAWDGLSYQASSFHGLAPGQWTDDTMMSKCLAESLLERHGYDPVDAAAHYTKWFLSGERRGMGRATADALGRLARGTPWDSSGVKGAEGNGTAMRAGVLGAFYHVLPASAAEFARLDATITHQSDEAQHGSAVIAAAVALLVTGVSKKLLLSWLLTHLPSTSKIYAGLRSIQAMQAENRRVEDVLGTDLQTGAHVVQTVPAAIAALVLTDSYTACVQAAIRAGGDTDTTAAVAGGLAGAHYGYAAIPEHLTKGLEACDQLRRLELDLMQYGH
jgi:ADP-ribosyl-[dinitrogen reductase] hydrolase